MSKSVKLLGRDQILGRADVPHEDVHVPEWGGTVRVQGMTVAVRSQWEISNTKRIRDRGGKISTVEIDWDAQATARERLVALSLIDENGARLFTDDDVKALAAKSAAAMERIVNVANRLNGVSAADIQELEGNSVATGDSELSTDSLPSSESQSLN